jgi:hypothetical protein
LVKPKFLAGEIDFLGRTIRKKGIMATLNDISAIENYKKPTSKKKMLSFLRFAGYEKQDVQNFVLFHKFP